MRRVVCELEVPGDPVAKGRPRHGKNGHTYTPARTQAAEEALGWTLRAACAGRTSLPVSVTVAFRCATRRRADLDNLVKLVLDSANGIVYDDDFQVVHIDASVWRGSANPGTSILIEEISA